MLISIAFVAVAVILIIALWRWRELTENWSKGRLTVLISMVVGATAFLAVLLVALSLFQLMSTSSESATRYSAPGPLAGRN